MELERDGNAGIDYVCEMLSSTSLNGVEEQSKILEKREKDPRKISRKYQTELCKKALEENVIVYLETGCGKTHIAVLLIYEMRHLIQKPQKQICIFLAPTVALVQQQAKVIEASIDLKVGTYFGSSSRLRFHRDWEKEIEENEVLVMTPKILLDNLSHCFIKLELIALLIFDECHYAQLESNHPYAEIMKIFYKVDLPQLPRIFGMTASPILGKGGSIDGLERLMRAKVYSVEDRNELEEFVTSPKMNIYYYGSTKDIYSSSLMILNNIKTQCMTALQMKKLDQNIIRSTKKLLQRLHSNIIFCLENLGLLGAKVASYTFLRSGQYESNEVLEVEDSAAEVDLCHKYLHNAGSVLSSACKGVMKFPPNIHVDGGMEPDLSAVEVLKEPYFSRKILRLIGILSTYRLQASTKCIIFVNRIVTAKSLSHILRNIKFLSHWKCGFLVGVSSGLVSRKDTDIILERFRSGELNLLIATKVGEEGLDIQTCCLVIRFDLPETVASFIQSRGRARMPQSEYVLLVDRSNPEEVKLIEAFKKEEAQMNEEISMRKNCFSETNFEEKTYKVDSTGATISSVSSISLLHRYCSKLPHDEYFKPKPEFYYLDDADGTVCNIILPTNAPIRHVVGEAQSSIEEAKRDACLKACKSLHEVGGLTDYLLPEQDDKYEELTFDKSITNTINDEESRAELHEMLVPSALRAKWRESEGSTCFSCYYIKFCPDPADRVYRSFGLFIKETLPEEVVKMKLELVLDRGRKVMTQLVPCGVTSFDKEEIDKAEKFQNMFLKAVLDRHELTSEFVSLETCDVCKSNSLTFYLLLPVITLDSNKILVDWTLMQRSLSSTIFRHPSINVHDESSQLGTQLNLDSGRTSAHDVVNSLVYIPFKKKFYFIADILTEKSGYSLYDDSKSHVEHYVDAFGINLVHPDQPLLKAKQLFILSNFLRKRMQGKWREKEEHFIEIPPEICQLKVIGFSKDIGSSLSVLPSVMHRLENFLVALELKERLIASFPEAAEVTLHHILEALTTEACGENFSLERFEVLGDSFLKFAVGRHLFLKHDTLDEGQLSSRRSNIVNNANLHALAIRNNLQVYIRDQALEADYFFPFGRSCPISCAKQTEKSVHSQCHRSEKGINTNIRCDKNHHWIQVKTISDVVEALIGAFIVDSGFKGATAFLCWLGIQVDFSPRQVDAICSASQAFLPLADKIDLNALENILKYKFLNKGLLIQAFVHPSYDNPGGCYQRLEYLGDSVLDYLITSYLYSKYPKLKPGHLSDLRSAAVSNISFADVARKWSFENFIICDSILREAVARYVNSVKSSGTKQGLNEERNCPKALGDIVESCIGALLLDTGFDLDQIWKTVLFLLDPVVSSSKLQSNPLRDLYELCQSNNWEMNFSTTEKDGKLFMVTASVRGENVSAKASTTNTSAKFGRKIVSREIFEDLKAQGYRCRTPSLEEVLKETVTKEAKLIGYDETPYRETDVLRAPEASQSDRDKETYSDISTKNPGTASGNVKKHQKGVSTSCVAGLSRKNGNNRKSSSKLYHKIVDSQGTGASNAVSAKSLLHELCAVNMWKPPLFECCNELGPSHLREYSFKVTMDTEKVPYGIIECFGQLRPRKKDAAESAAQGALRYLKTRGYISDNKKIQK